MLRLLLGLLSALADYFRNRQLIEAGKAEQAAEAVKEVEARVEQARDVDAAADLARTERLRSRFDRSRSGQ